MLFYYMIGRNSAWFGKKHSHHYLLSLIFRNEPLKTMQSHARYRYIN